MFRNATIAGLVLAVVAGVIAAGMVKRQAQAAAPLLAGQRFGLWARGVHAVVALGLFILAVTGLVAAFLPNGLTGWLLFAHFGGAPMFMGGLAALALTFAGPASAGCGQAVSERPRGAFTAEQSCAFWSTLVLGLVTVGPILLSMMPWFSSEAQHTMYTVHKCGGLALVMLAIGHGVVTLVARPQLLKAITLGGPAGPPVPEMATSKSRR